MVEAGGESRANQPRAEVVKKVEVDGRKLVVLKASPLNKEARKRAEGGESPAPVLYIGGHNLRPKKVDDQVKTGFDIQELADSISSDIYSIVRVSNGEGTDNARLAERENDPQGVSITNLHQAKADEIMQAIAILQKEEDRVLPALPLYLIGYSDGGIVAALLLDAQPDLFDHFIIHNTPLETVKTRKMYARAIREGIHAFGHVLSPHEILQRLKNDGASREKITVQRSEDDGYAESSYTSKPLVEKRAIARTKSLLSLLPKILDTNKKLRGFIVNTQTDLFSPTDRVASEWAQVLQGVEADERNEFGERVQIIDSEWESHIMGHKREARTQKLGDIGGLMVRLRSQDASAGGPTVGLEA